MEGELCAAGSAHENSWTLSSGGQRSSGAGPADGSSFGSSGGVQRDDGPGFDHDVPPTGYVWWYVDALSTDRQYGLTIIGFIGSVFSPYYAWSGRQDPLNHCAINVALYGRGGQRWAMTERSRKAVERSPDHLHIGPSAMHWDGQGLTITLREISTPFFKPVRGQVRLVPKVINAHSFPLAQQGQHHWRPIAPLSHVQVEFSDPHLHWAGDGYFDMNWGAAPLEDAFVNWTWSRASQSNSASVLYNTHLRDQTRLSLALRFSSQGGFEHLPSPAQAKLPRSKWGLSRSTGSDDGQARLVTSFEDTPFYSRSLIASSVFGDSVTGVHESLSLDRFAHPLVKCMLPFRMPRR